MTRRTLLSIAVASTLGWSAGAFAGSGHEVITPSASSEIEPSRVQQQDESFGSRQDRAALGSISDEAGGSIGGSFGDQSASASTDQSFALGDQGLYSDYYLVSWTPVASDNWSYYTIDTDSLASSGGEGTVMTRDYELALLPSGSDDSVYELAFVPVMSIDDMSSGFAGSAGDSGK